jgi:hypothetical protein
MTMTTICWDGKTLAGDKQMTCNGVPVQVTKIHRSPDGALLGASGDADVSEAMKQWYMAGAVPEKFPAKAVETGSETQMLVITQDGQIRLYCRAPIPLKIESEVFALGSGCDFALAAMHLGRCSVDAMVLACQLDVHTGMGFDTLQLNRKPE